jgi:EAL domain-containing protein (putative c-di-GMP-specific phosphodiesterase class I)
VTFHDGMHERLVRRVELETALRGAIERDELRLVFQPIFELATGTLVGAEALARWRHRDEEIPPTEFIAIAEDSSLITDIGRWVLEHACAAAAGWHELRPDGPLPRIAVNVSGRQVVEGDLVADVRSALAASGLEPACLTIELTESAVMEHSGVALDRLDALRRLGVRVSIDDFGTGYSSLGRLQALPVDEVKIDRSFIDVDPVVESVLALGASLGLDVVAEGIELPEQLARLRDRGCAGQGYLLGRPMAADDLALLVAGTGAVR